MSNVEGSQSESLGEVTRHLAGAIGVPTTSESRNLDDAGYHHSQMEGVPSEVLTSDNSVAQDWGVPVMDAEDAGEDRLEDADEIAYDREPRAVVSGSNYRITIEKQNYGFIVKIGCQTFAIEKPETIGTMITTFLSNSVEAEKAWYNTSGNNRLEETLQQFQ